MIVICSSLSHITVKRWMFTSTKTSYLKFFRKYKFFHSKHRDVNVESKLLTSAQVRKIFLDYFMQRDHIYIHSSSVLPKHDKSLLFVNSGMNQFKPLFLGTLPQGNHLKTLKRATNTQKCIRISGKHNDIDDVGKDGYHHTFFEMLGNWSFRDYFKQEACAMAWELLTGVFKLPSRQLYVTYFGGDRSQGLEADLECQEIWLNLGVHKDHILPFGVRENFWEMGKTGPCGPCTEIHFDHTGTENMNGINAGRADVVELWNLVFIQYERETDGSLRKLENFHIDTGMGLERLVAILQNSQSNYDTDLFQPIFDAICQNCKLVPYLGKYGSDDKTGIDTAYRIVADHVRMITVAITDGVLPSEFGAGNCLRRIIKRAISVADKHFQAPPTFLASIVPHVANVLGETFPEIVQNDNMSKVVNVINEEEERMRLLIKNVEKRLDKIACKSKTKIVTGEQAYQLYAVSGLSEDVIEELAKEKGLTVHSKSFKENINIALESSSSGSLSPEEECLTPSIHAIEKLEKMNVPCTNDEYKYNYTSCEHYYRFDPLTSQIVAIISNDNIIREQINEGCHCWIVVKETNFYAEAGGQVSDIGDIGGQSFLFKVKDVQKCQGYIFHWGLVEKGTIKVNDEVHLALDKLHRVRCMRNHTATHMLQSALKKILPSTVQESSFVGPSNLQFSFNSKAFLNIKEVEKIESIIISAIKQQLDITRSVLPLQQALAEPDIVTIPGQFYPEVVNVISIGKEDRTTDFSSIELCGGTHLHNTNHVSSFVITSQKKENQNVRSLHAVTGKPAQAVIGIGERLSEEVTQLENTILNQKERNYIEPGVLKNVLTEIRRIRKVLSDTLVPLRKHLIIENKLDNMEIVTKSLVRQFTKTLGIKQLQRELEELMRNTQEKYYVHEIKTVGDENQLIKLGMEIVKDKPVMLFIRCFYNNRVLCQCRVPEGYVSSTFNAEKWIAPALEILEGTGSSKKQNADNFFSVTGKNSKTTCERLPEAIEICSVIAKESL